MAVLLLWRSCLRLLISTRSLVMRLILTGRALRATVAASIVIALGDIASALITALRCLSVTLRLISVAIPTIRITITTVLRSVLAVRKLLMVHIALVRIDLLASPLIVIASGLPTAFKHIATALMHILLCKLGTFPKRHAPDKVRVMGAILFRPFVYCDGVAGYAQGLRTSLCIPDIRISGEPSE